MILLTGATGFVGSTILNRLATLGVGPVAALGRRRAPGITVCDLLRPREADVPWGRVEHVIHCAALIPSQGPADHFDNVRMLHNLLGLLPLGALKSFVLLSSVAVYPLDAGRPCVDLAEDGHEPPADAYGRSKLTQEWLARAACAGRVPLAVLRPSSVYGAGNTSRTLLPIFVEQARSGRPLTLKGSSRYVQNFVHVDDVARVAVRAALEKVEGAFNVFSRETLSTLALAERVVRFFASASAIVDERDSSPYPQVAFTDTRLTQQFGPARLSLEEGLRKTIYA